MGVVVPHGGFINELDVNIQLQWLHTSSQLDSAVIELGAEFAEANKHVGFFHHGPTVMPLVFLQDESGNEWYLCVNGKCPVGLPEYFFTEETAKALQRATIPCPKLRVLEVDGREFRLHAACLNGLHVALLIPAEK